MPAEKRFRNRSHGYDIKDDLNYIDDESDLSSGDLNMSDAELPVEHSRKRGRPKSQTYHPKEEPKRRSPATSSASPLNQQTYLSNHYESDLDDSGEQKVDKFGRLLGGREYRVPTFTLPTRGETQFMFSKDPAALLGFRDSFVFLKKNVKLVKVHIDTVEKGHLVDLNLLRSTFRTREISVVTARSVFKQFGHRVVRKGKRGRDDYYYTEELDEGEDDLSEDEQNIKDTVEKPQIASYTPVFEVGKNNLAHKPTSHDSSSNNSRSWLHNAAVSTRQFNSSIFNYRRSNPTNYDLLTNVYQIPECKQAFVDTDVFLNPQENTLENTANSNNLSLLNDDVIPQQFADDFLNFGHQ